MMPLHYMRRWDESWVASNNSWEFRHTSPSAVVFPNEDACGNESDGCGADADHQATCYWHAYTPLPLLYTGDDAADEDDDDDDDDVGGPPPAFTAFPTACSLTLPPLVRMLMMMMTMTANPRVTPKLINAAVR